MTQTETVTAEAAEVIAAVLYGKKDMRIETKVLESPGSTELQIRVTETGICGSDLHYYHHGRNGDFALQHPLSLGHESAGVVTAVGSDVHDFKVGDKVALEVGIPCSECKWCRKGRYNLCPDMRFRSSCKTAPHFDGTLVQKVNHPAKWCHKVPDAVKDLSLAALVEPLAVSLQGIKRSELNPEDEATVLVLGAGAVGLLTAFAAKKRGGANKVVIADISAQRVSFAVDNGFADQGIVLVGSKSTDSDNPLAPAIASAKFLKEEAGVDVGFDVVFECTGVQICVQTSVFAAAAGTKVVLIGMGTPIQTFAIGSAATREVDIIGVFRYAGNYPDALAIVAEDGETVGKIVTHRMKLLQAVEAFEIASTPVDKDGNLVLKVMITE
ncbi:chaperonin 10-like protein [Lipomyces chichibuensis]|uniref:chaperonin 10-like protein n=1 Tax=Lipomyces chichibuensis TaxID=1546026 RepID=UPI0033432397